MTFRDRRTGWLSTIFHARFRELLTHTAARFRVACPVYVLMPDHLHLVLMGWDPASDQLKATRYLKKQINLELKRGGDAVLQHQSHDRVLRDDERQETSFRQLVEYIAKNPERAGLINPGGYRNYEFLDCLIPGYPEVHFGQDDFWLRLDRTISFLRHRGLFRPAGEGRPSSQSTA